MYTAALATYVVSAYDFLVRPLPANAPAVSVIIPMYNAEKYIGECLDSLLEQTFQDFEVIIVDDCSTDNSVAIVENYAPKFGGRLTLEHMEKNTGSGALPRNKGFLISRGEYVFNMDNDDVLTKTALEEMYSLAREYRADVVYCERYFMSTGVGEEFVKNIHIADDQIQKPPFVDKPTFETKDLSERVNGILKERFWVTPWVKLVRRDVIARHKIFFPFCAISDDNIWTYGLVFYADKFLRVPNIVYVYRVLENSLLHVKRTPQQTLSFWLSPILNGIKELDKFMGGLVFFKRNPQLRYAILKYFFDTRLNLAFRDANQLSELEIYGAIKEHLEEQPSNYDVLIPALFSKWYSDRKTQEEQQVAIRKELYKFTARIDFTLIPTAGTANFQILSVSDSEAKVRNATWVKKGIGYYVQSHAGKLTFSAKVITDGKFSLELKGMWVPTPEDRTKLIPYWIDYTKLVVNRKTILDKLTPTWHNKPYNYSLEVKAGEEIKVEIEWLPHRRKDGFLLAEIQSAVSIIIPMYNAEKYIGECLNSLLAQTFQDFEVIVVDDCSTDDSVSIVEKYAPKFGGRLTLAHMDENTGSGSLPRNKGLSLSCGEYIFNMDNDDALTQTGLEEMYTLAKEYGADVVYCEWYYKSDNHLENRVLTCSNKRGLVDKPTIESNLLSERVNRISSFWVTPWTKLVKRDLLVKNRILFPNIIRDDTIWTWNLVFHSRRFLRVPNAVYVWREVPSSITRSNKTPEQKITFWLNPVICGVETLDEIMSSIGFFQENPQNRYALLEEFIQGSFNSRQIFDAYLQLGPLGIFSVLRKDFSKAIREHDILIPALCAILCKEKKAHKEDMETIRKGLYKLTARIDFKLVPTAGTANFQILSVSDSEAKVSRSNWLKQGIGYYVHSYAGRLAFAVKVITDGKFYLILRGVWVPTPEDRTKLIPYWIDYTKLVVNGKTILDKLTPCWHDKPYNYSLEVKAGEEIKVEIEWLPHRSET